MRFKWTYQGPRLTLQTFLQHQGFSLAQLKQLKFHGGLVFVNKKQRHTAFTLRPGDVIFLQTAPEVPADSVVPFSAPLAIAYEDEYVLVVNKPAGVPSIPDVGKSPDTMANRVKAYLIATHAESTAVHVVTRLDRDTSGLMLFAKSGLIHSLLDTQLHTDALQKDYLAVVSGTGQLPKHGWLVLPIGRSQAFYMKRQVAATGKQSVTEFETLRQTERAAVVRVQLHTGRTHQIRVHFAAIGHPLFGDDLYGGPSGMGRQALHCVSLRFWHPIFKKPVALTAPVPEDMLSLEDELGLAQK